MSLANAVTKIDAAVAAHVAGDHAAALARLSEAEMYLTVVPDSRHATSEIRFRTQQIAALRGQIKQSRNAAAGVRRSNMKYVATADTPG